MSLKKKYKKLKKKYKALKAKAEYDLPDGFVAVNHKRYMELMEMKKEQEEFVKAFKEAPSGGIIEASAQISILTQEEREAIAKISEIENTPYDGGESDATVTFTKEQIKELDEKTRGWDEHD